MEADRSPLLARLIDHTDPPAPGRHSLQDALQRLNITSVFDIVALSENEFFTQLARYNDDDARQIYRKALSAAAQLEALFREQQVSSVTPSQRKKRADSRLITTTGATYNRLFKENWQQYCASDSIAAIDSPVAYLRALYLFAMQLERDADAATAIKLAERRPDLKDMLIDPHSVSNSVPMLTIINHTLLKNIGATDHKQAYQLLSAARYPFSLPYHFHHQQCLLSLSAHGTALGALNYRISRTLPISKTAAHAYGQVTEQNHEVQCLLSGLSPSQQTLLTDDPSLPQALYGDYYQWEPGPDAKGPERISDFLRHTQLDAVQLQALLAQQTYQPRQSPHCLLDPGFTYGACYINGQANPPVSLSASHLLNVSSDRFDRLQRMIRLQRWLAVPFAQLDTLIVSAMRCEGAANPSLLINHNTLRTLGVYRYLNQHYGLHAEEFAALLHQLPIRASGDRLPLFDQVFNRAGSALPPLQLDGGPFDAITRQQLCVGLGLQDTEDSLQRLINTDSAPTRTIATLSTIYRQARIARLFGLSIRELEHLVQLLGPATYQAQLLRPTLRKALQGPVDLLDLLMHLDWASRWIRDNRSSLMQLRHQLCLEPISQDATINRLLEAFSRHRQPGLSERLAGLTLPEQPSDEQPRLPAVEWPVIVNQVIQRCRADRPVEVALDQVLGSIKLSQYEGRTAALISTVRHALLPFLDKISLDLWTLHRSLINIIDTLPRTLPRIADDLKKYDSPEYLFRLYAPLAAPSTALQAVSHLILLLPHAADFLQLPVSRETLHQFLVNPHWLIDTYQANSLLEVSLHTLFLMQQFKYCIDHHGVAEEQLLDYFKLANTAQDESTDANALLARLLGWGVTDIQILSQTLTPPRVNCMDRLDWVLRCRQASTRTGLPVELLLKTCQLQNRSTFEHWQVVGDAMASAQH